MSAGVCRARPRDRCGAQNARRSLPIERLGEPSELAAAAVFLCSTRAAYITGETLAVDGGKTRSVF